MIAETQRHGAAARAMARPLKRGKACMNCRFLKIKCDGAKPVCGPCERHPKDDVCEYSDGPGRSRTKALEDTVSRLEARLYELEHPDESTPAVTLFDPYKTHAHPSQSSPSLLIPETRRFTSSTPFSPVSASSSLPSTRHWKTFGSIERTDSTMSSTASSGSPLRHVTSSPSILGADEPPHPVIQNLLDAFLPHASEFGFFLNPKRFREGALRIANFGHHSRPSPSVLSAVYLWGVHLSRSEPLLALEHTFMNRALQHTATDLLGSHPDSVLHALQAQVLIAYYLLRIGRFLEAKCYTASAVSVAVSAGFHRIRAPVYARYTIGLSQDAPISLPSPQDAIEEGERINGFWSVLMLHKYLMIALEPPNSVCGTLEAPGMHIDTPWPMDLADYPEGRLTADIQGSNTVRNYLSHTPEMGYPGHSTIAMNVKAAILFHRSAQLTGQWTPNLQPREFQAFSAAFQSIHRLIEQLRSTLPPLSHLDPRNPSTRAILLTHALTDAATIKLHNIFSYANSASKQHCLVAAHNLVNFGGLSIQDVGHVNPIMSTLWVSACHVFIDEISRVRSLQNVDAQWAQKSESGEEELMESLRKGMAALATLSDESSYTRYQLNKIQEAFSAI